MASFKMLLTNMPNPLSVLNPFSYLPYRFPLTLNTLKGAVKQKFGDDVVVKLYDRQQEPDTKKLMDLIRTEEFSLVGFSVQAGQKNQIRQILNYIYKHIPVDQRPHLVLGNTLPTYAAEDFLKDYPGIFVVCSEGEYGLNGLIECLKDGKCLRDVPNLAYTENDTVKINPIVPVKTKDIAIPTVDNLNKTIKLNGIVQLEASRGCSWGRCTFCNRYRQCDGWRGFPIKVVVKELRRFHDKGVRQIAFSDEDFIGSDFDRASALAKAIIDEKIEMRYWSSVKTRDIYCDCDTDLQKEQKRETLSLLKQAGVNIVFVGIESGCDTQLRRYGKGIDSHENAQAIDLLREMGFQIVCGFIMFDPFVKIEEIKENIEFIEHKHIAENAYCFNALNVCEYNKKFWRNLKLSGLSKGKQMNSIYFDWDFEHKGVASIYSIVKEWERTREHYYQMLNTFHQNVIDSNKSGQLRYLQMKYRQIQKSSRIFDLAFLKTILLCFENFSDANEFLASTLSQLGFTDGDTHELVYLSGDYRISNNISLKKHVLRQIVSLFAERKRTYLQQSIESITPTKQQRADKIVLRKLIKAIEGEANLTVANFS